MSESKTGDPRFATMESAIGRDGYKAPDWIEDGGRYFDADGHFNPGAYDPAAKFEPQGVQYKLTSNPERNFEDPFDLDNLRFLDKRHIENLLTILEGKAAEIAQSDSDKRIVAMIGTGGTIAMTMVDGRLEPTLDPEYLLAYAGGALNQRFAVASAEYPRPIDSSEQEIDYEADLVIAMSWIWKNMSSQLKDKFDGFLVTHGTDTMGGGSTNVTMMLGPNCPFSVGFVGAQKTTQDEFTDVGANVSGSFGTLATLRRRGKVARFVYMGGTEGGAFHPAGVMKKDDKVANAFRAPLHDRLVNAADFGLHGIVDQFGRRYAQTLERGGARADFQPTIVRGYTPLIDLAPKIGTDPRRYYEQIIRDATAVAVMITTFGSYTANSKIRRAITLAAQQRGMLVLGANPFPGGSTDHSYGPARALRDSGAYPVGTLPDATAAKVLLGSRVFGANREMLAAFLTSNSLIGEQDPGSWMVERDGDGVLKDVEDTSTGEMPRFGAPNAMFEKN